LSADFIVRLPPFEFHKTYLQPFPLAAWGLLMAGRREVAA